MIWLFIIAFAAWCTYRIAATTEYEAAPRVAWWAVVVAALALLVIALRFSFMETGVDFADEYLPMKAVGLGTLFIPVINLFIALGPMGNALLWGALGLFLLRKAWDGGWYRGALALRQIAAEDTTAREKKEHDTEVAREYWTGRRRAWFERQGAALGRFTRDLLRKP